MLTGENLQVGQAEFFNIKLGCFAVMKKVYGANVRTCLKLKGKDRFCPASLRLPMHIISGCL